MKYLDQLGIYGKYTYFRQLHCLMGLMCSEGPTYSKSIARKIIGDAGYACVRIGLSYLATHNYDSL